MDKCSFPRVKLYSGLLTQKTVSLIDNVYGVICFPCERITSNLNLVLGTHKIMSVTANTSADGANSRIRKYIDRHFRPNVARLECDYPSKTIKDETNIYLSFVP